MCVCRLYSFKTVDKSHHRQYTILCLVSHLYNQQRSFRYRIFASQFHPMRPERIVNIWNRLDEDIVSTPSVNSLKKQTKQTVHG